MRVAQMICKDENKTKNKLVHLYAYSYDITSVTKHISSPSPSSTTACTTMGKISLSISNCSWGEKHRRYIHAPAQPHVNTRFSDRAAGTSRLPRRRPTRWGWRCVMADRTAGKLPFWSVPSQTAVSCPGAGNCRKQIDTGQDIRGR